MSVKVGRCYTEEDKSVFLDLLTKYKDIVESKKSNAATLKQKEEAWAKITFEFNKSDLTSQERTAAQLRKWWSNMKQHQREAKTKENQERMGTGGGPETPAPTLDPSIDIIVPHLIAVAPTHFSSNMSGDELETAINSSDFILVGDTSNNDNKAGIHK